LIDTLIKDKYFKDNTEMIIDEAITFFFAGMATLRISTTNMLVYLVRQPELKAKLILEVEKVTSKYKSS